jgi:hypothetical protein
MGAPMGSGAQTSPRDVAEVVDRDALAVLIHREFQRVWKHVGFAWDPRAVMLRRLSEKQGVSCSFRGLRAYSELAENDNSASDERDQTLPARL